MFAITAITGKVGGAVARALLDAGDDVRAVVRDHSKGAAWAARGCEIAIADVADPGPLAAALAGVEGAFILLPPAFDPAHDFADVKRNIAVIREALGRAQPPKAVVLSTIGADADRPNLLNGLRLLEEALSDLPFPITFLRAAWFMENAAWDVPDASRDGVVGSYLQPLDRSVAMVATEDVGRTAAALLRETWTGHRIVELEGPARVSPGEIADAFAKALCHPVRAKAIPRGEWEKIFNGQGMRNPEPRMRMLDGFNEGWIDFPHRDATRKGRITIDEAIATLVGNDRGGV